MTTLAPNCVQFPEPIMCSSNQVLVNYVWLGGQFGLSHTCKTRDRAMAEALFGFSPIYTPATNSCTPTSVNSTQPCDPGYVGNKIITTSTSCPGNVVTTTTNTSGCSLACVPQAAQTQFVPCGGNLSGTKMQTNTFSCPSGTWSGWVDTDTSMCVANNSLAQQQCQTKGGSWNTSTQHCDCNAANPYLAYAQGVFVNDLVCSGTYQSVIPHGGTQIKDSFSYNGVSCINNIIFTGNNMCFGNNKWSFSRHKYVCNEGTLTPENVSASPWSPSGPANYECPAIIGNDPNPGGSGCAGYTNYIDQTTTDSMTYTTRAKILQTPPCNNLQVTTSLDAACMSFGTCRTDSGSFGFFNSNDCSHNVCSSVPRNPNTIITGSYSY
jgi:hypothetical protein